MCVVVDEFVVCYGGDFINVIGKGKVMVYDRDGGFGGWYVLVV